MIRTCGCLLGVHACLVLHAANSAHTRLWQKPHVITEHCMIPDWIIMSLSVRHQAFEGLLVAIISLGDLC